MCLCLCETGGVKIEKDEETDKFVARPLDVSEITIKQGIDA